MNRNCLSYWFPKIEAAGLPVPETRIVVYPIKGEDGLFALLDGKIPSGWEPFLENLRIAIHAIGGVPCFLRTGQTSGKHYWIKTCYLADLADLGQHIYELVEFSECCNFIGLPHDVWVVRKLLNTAPIFKAFRGFPVVREFRAFVDSGKLACVHPYWPADSIEDHTEEVDWQSKLSLASELGTDRDAVGDLAIRAGAVLPGAWSVDLLQDATGKWWVTDCADAGCSFHWEGCENKEKWLHQPLAE